MTAALLGALLTAIPVFIAWASDPKSSAPGNDAFGVSLDLWALAHRAHVTSLGTRVVATPLLLTAAYVLLTRYAALAAFPKERLATRDLRVVLAGFVGGYVVGAQLVGVLSSIGPARTSWWSLILGPAAVAALGAMTVYLTMRERSPEVAATDERLRNIAPLVLRRAVVPSLRTLRWWVVSGLLLWVALIAWHGSRVWTIHDQLHPGLTGTILLVLGQLLFLPNLAIYGGSWLAGGEVTVGAAHFGHGTMTPGTVPIIPVLGALPDTTGPSWTWVSALTIVLLGAYLGVQAARATAKLSSLRIKSLVTAASVVLTTVGAGLLMWASSLSVSTGLLGFAGTNLLAWPLFALELTLGAALAVPVWHWWQNHRPPKR